MVNFSKFLIFAIFIAVAFYFIQSFDHSVIKDQTILIKILLGMIAGLFYTSFLTTPFAIVMLIVLGQHMDIYLLTVAGGLGGAIGDLFIVKIFRVLFKFFSFVKHEAFFKEFKLKLKKAHLNLVSIVLGFVIIASPFPDELGLILLGAAKLSYFKLAIISYISNMIGIFMVLLAAQALKL